MIYYFYITNDKTKEAIGTTKARTEEGAITLFSKGKMLSVESFNKIYSVDVKND